MRGSPVYMKRFCYCSVLKVLCTFWVAALDRGVFANILSQLVDCLFILLTVSFEEQKLLIFIKSSLLIFSFINYAFSVICKKSQPNPRPPCFLLVLQFCFTFMPRTTLSSFLQATEYGSRVIFFHVDI